MQEIKLETNNEKKDIGKILKNDGKNSNSGGQNGGPSKKFDFKSFKDFFGNILQNKKTIAMSIGGIICFILLVVLLISLANNSLKPEAALGNLNNNGKVFQDGENVYIGLSEGLFKEKDNTFTKVSNDKAISILKQGDAIYYLSSASQRSYDIKVLKDGSEEPQIIKTINTPINKIFVYNDNIYYFSSENGYGIRKISIEDLNEGLVVLANIIDFTIEDNVLYYTDIVGKLERIKLNKEDETPSTIDSEHGIRKFQIKDKWIYFYSNNEGGLCKIKTNGKGFELVNNNITSDTYNITDEGNIYFLDKTKTKICKSKIGKKSYKTIVETRITSSTINIAAGNLYYDDYESDTTSVTKLFRIKTNGKTAKEMKIPEEPEKKEEEIDIDKIKETQEENIETEETEEEVNSEDTRDSVETDDTDNKVETENVENKTETENETIDDVDSENKNTNTTTEDEPEREENTANDDSDNGDVITILTDDGATN